MRGRADFRPERGEYLMSVAVDQAARCNCRKTAVGAIVARDDRIISTGYNGTIAGFTNCIDGGCPRCKDPGVQSGTELDRCICVHAEQNALLTAARFGVRAEEAECWVTTEPCLDCTKQLIQAQLAEVYYWKPYPLPRAESQQLRQKMKKHAEKVTRFRRWIPKTDVLGLEARYQGIKDRLDAYVQAKASK
jgi:dCMP deaminase